MKAALLIALFSACVLLQSIATARASCAPVAYQQVAAEWQVPADVLYAISLVESGRQTDDYGFNLWPWALNIDEQSYYPKSQEAALSLIETALERGTDKIAIGLMQVYWGFHHELFNGNPVYALDIATNMRAGAKILRDFMDQTNDLWTAVGYYYAGTSQSDRSRRLATAYADRVQSFYVRHVIGGCNDHH